ncbi:MAG TPA: hypothetical protein VG963_29045 [Polyangiaceae bacterium]|nr:hypothetical protein [Polyangiaceae bacterium]
MTQTRIIRFHRTGGPEVLQIDTVPMPRPGAGEVLVRAEALALSRADLLWRAGTYIEEPDLPSRIGYDMAGVDLR